MTISIKKFNNDVMRYLKPKERVGLILELQEQWKHGGDNYQNEIRQIQLEMPEEQREEYAKIAFTVILTNRILFEFALLSNGNFYQKYTILLSTILAFIPRNSPEKMTEDIVNMCYQELVQTYQEILSLFFAEKEIARRLNLKKVFYPIYSDYIDEIKEKIRELLKPVKSLGTNSDKVQMDQPNLEIQKLLIQTILQAVDEQLTETF